MFLNSSVLCTPFDRVTRAVRHLCRRVSTVHLRSYNTQRRRIDACCVYMREGYYDRSLYGNSRLLLTLWLSYTVHDATRERAGQTAYRKLLKSVLS